MLITYRLTSQDVLEGYKRYRQGVSPLVRIVYYGLTWVLRISLIGFGLFLIAFDETVRSLGTVFVLIAACSILFSIFARRISAARYFKKNPSLRKEYKAQFDEDGVEWWSEDLHTKSGWSNFLRWQESKSVFLLYPTTRIFNIIPKRAFAPGEVEQFHALLTRKFPKK